MRRPSSTRVLSPSPAFARFACVGAVLAGCLSSESIDLGTNYDPGLPAPDSSVVTRVPESGVDAVADAPDDDPDAPDAPTDAGAADAPSPPLIAAPICISNESFEPIFADDALAQGPLLTDPPEWQVCSSSAATQQACVLPPTDGSSYLGLSIGLAPILLNPASVDNALCQPLQAGITYSLSLDLALDAPTADADTEGEPPALQVRGSNTACDPRADLLLRFSGATNTCGWRRGLCGTFVAQQTYSHLILIPEATSSTGLVYKETNLLVDNLRSGGPCPKL
jgi:hypothetical protein